MKNQETLHSRREFFRVTAKKVLPVIGLLSIAKAPLFGQIYTLDCNGSCYQTCAVTARGMCDTCSHLCLGGCQGTSKGKVQDSIRPKNDTIKKDNNGCSDNCKTECRMNCNGYCVHSCKDECGHGCVRTCLGTCTTLNTGWIPPSVRSADARTNSNHL